MISTADLSDEYGDAIEVCSAQLRSFGRKARFSGQVRTVRCHEDNALVRTILSQPGEGAVLVIDGGGSLRVALVGDMLASQALANGWAGIVVNGAIRDTCAIAALDVGIKALGTNPRRGTREGAGSVDVAVEFGGATFMPGATLVSDEDGLIVIPGGA